MRDLVIDKENYIDYTNPINKMFFEIEKNISVNGLSVQQAYIIKNKSMLPLNKPFIT